MLQQTQVIRVQNRWGEWLDLFPTIDSLAAAPLEAVLAAWQGMGYNRRAVALKRTAEICSGRYGGEIPRGKDELLALPGVGPSTAAGVRIFAHSIPDIYLETNVRTVYLHEFFPDEYDIPDKDILVLLEQSCPDSDPREWYYALLDYGAYLKKILPNPSRRSKHHTQQSTFEGSKRQKRAWLLRRILATGASSTDELVRELSIAEQAGGRSEVTIELTREILEGLTADAMLFREGDELWSIAH
ncbi:MAG: adenine glycosylase [Actinobacteria bacterium]|nr:adenine glycosylase [Actinomycetota bacterium]